MPFPLPCFFAVLLIFEQLLFPTLVSQISELRSFFEAHRAFNSPDFGPACLVKLLPLVELAFLISYLQVERNQP